MDHGVHVIIVCGLHERHGNMLLCYDVVGCSLWKALSLLLL